MKVLSWAVVLLLAPALCAGVLADLEDLSLADESYWNGSDNSGGFISGTAGFNNSYTDWGGGFYSWGGFSYSNVTDTETAGLAGQYNAITGGGQGGSSNYAVGFVDTFGPVLPTITFDTAQVVGGLYVTNNNYAYYSMLNGNMFSKKFGGQTGDDPDWFLMTITGKDAAGAVTGTTEFYLADYRSADNSLDYIIDSWEFINLGSLGVVKNLELTLSSSDVGDWGMNTPAYFALDTIVSEPPPLVQALQDIEDAIEAKTRAVEAIDEALCKEQAALRALSNLPAADVFDDPNRADIYKAEVRIRLAMMRQRQARRTLRKSIQSLDSTLSILTGGQQQPTQFGEGDKIRSRADINSDGTIDQLDLAIMSGYWLQSYE